MSNNQTNSHKLHELFKNIRSIRENILPLQYRTLLHHRTSPNTSPEHEKLCQALPTSGIRYFQWNWSLHR